MSIPFQTLVRQSAMLKYALLGVLAGIGLVIFGFVSDNSMPEQASLQTIEGNVTRATKVTTQRRRGGTSVRYELTVQPASGEPVKLSIPEAEISEMQVRGIVDERITARYNAENDVYMLNAGSRALITYENTVRIRHEANRTLEIVGALVLALSGAVAGIAAWWTRRRLMKQLAAWQAEQAQHPPAQPSAG